MTRQFLTLGAFFSLLACAQAESALQWDHRKLELHPSTEQKTVRADFSFTNIGQQPVVIEAIKSSCGCTTAALEKNSYQPGEKGHLRAIFTIGNRKGVQVKEISVAIRGESSPTVLTLVTQIPEAAKLDPQFVFWRTGEAPRSKTIQLKLPAGQGLRSVRVSSSDQQILASVETVKEGSEYQITVTPQGTERQAMATLNIQATADSNATRAFQAYAQVKGP